MTYILPKRTKGRIKANIVTKDFYNFYKSQIKPIESIRGGETLGSYKLTARQYSDILKDINNEIIKLVILENFEFKLPYSLGKVSIVQRKVKLQLDKDGNLSTRNLTVNYRATLDLWNIDEEAKNKKSLVFHTNEHTNGYSMNWFWSRRGCKCRGIEVYYFIPCRQMKRAPSKFLKDPDLKLAFYERPNKLRKLRDPKKLNKHA